MAIKGNQTGASKKIRLRKGDKVQVISGTEKGKGPVEVMKVFPETGRVLIKGVNIRTKHLKKTQENPKGGIVKKEFPIDVSKVLLFSEKLKKGVRIRVERKDGKSVRVGVPCGTQFD